MRLILVLASALLMLGCESRIDTSSNSFAEITPTTGVFTEQDEAAYLLRYAELVKAFSSGQETTNYDTEIYFAQDHAVSPLERVQAQSLTPEIIAELTQYANEQNSDSFIIAENGRVVAESYFGNTTAESLINSKSLAKPLGAIAMGRAIELGFIKSLDQSAADFIIEWKGTDKEAITLRYLLQMRSGLLKQAGARDAESVLNRAYLHPRHDEVIIHEYPLTDLPGSVYEYSNANSELIAVIIQRATGMSYQNWLEKEVLQPLGASGGKIWINREGGTAHSGCCVGLPSETYLKLAILVSQNGEWDGKQFLSLDYIEQMLTATEQNKYAGMGIYLGRHYKKYRGAGNPDVEVQFGGTLHSEPYVDIDIALFDGNGNQVAYIMPSRNIVILRLGKKPRNEQVPWDNAYIPNTVSRHLDKK